MPVLPSGKKIELIPQMRQINFIDDLPDPGFFWIDTPEDIRESNLPGEAEINRPMKQVPLPESIDEFLQYISIVVVDQSGFPEITDFTLKNFPPKGYLNRTDHGVWTSWIRSEPVKLYLEIRMSECFDQVEYLTRRNLWEAANPNAERGKQSLVKRYDLFLQNEAPEEKKKRHERNIKRAREYIERLAVMEVTDRNAQVTWVDLLLEQLAVTQTWYDGEILLAKHCAADPRQLAYHIGYLKCLFEERKFTEVEKDVWEALKQYPKNIEYWQIMINIFFYQQKYDDALQIVASAQAINPDNQDLLDFQYRIEKAMKGKDNQ